MLTIAPAKRLLALQHFSTSACQVLSDRQPPVAEDADRRCRKRETGATLLPRPLWSLSYV
jgi:hypothetical protein